MSLVGFYIVRIYYTLRVALTEEEDIFLTKLLDKVTANCTCTYCSILLLENIKDLSITNLVSFVVVILVILHLCEICRHGKVDRINAYPVVVWVEFKLAGKPFPLLGNPHSTSVSHQTFPQVRLSLH